MTLTNENLDLLKKYGSVRGLESSLNDSDVNQNPRQLSKVLQNLGAEVLEDPLMGLRRNPADMSNETLRYLGYNWDHENGYNISGIIDENLDEIVEK